MVAEIIINSTVKNLNRIFDYQIPQELEKSVFVGSRVFVPFGRSKSLEEGFVIGIKEKSDFKIKDISSVQEKTLTEENIMLAKWMAKRYFCNLADCIKLMLPPGTASKEITNRIKEKMVNVIYLKKSEEEIQYAIDTKILKSEKQIRIIRFLQENDGVTMQDLEIFVEATRAVEKTLEKNGYVEIIEKQVERNPFLHKQVERTTKLTLTEEQQEAYTKIENAIEEKYYQEYLLFGITGSGKTEIYLQLIEKVIKQEKAAIILVPEIALTPQMMDRFIARFGQDIICVLHSKLSVGERYDQWNKIKEGKAKIVIGARSAIFAPVKDLGIIIIDEEHDNSYKSEMNPRYNAKEIASKIAKQKQIPILLGSATPDITTFYKAENKEIELLTLTKRANHSILPTIKVVDLRRELAEGNRSMISRPLYKAIQENIKEGKQTILFLNRRGFSTFVMCRDCGHTLTCKNCNISLTYHKKEDKLKCHYCGFEEDLVTVCPECGSKNIRHFGTGTQKLEQEIQKLFPQASTIRMDIDTITQKNSHEEILNTFQRENINILIGTQMIVKGHHFPNVTLVGVIAADASLNVDDYRSSERTFDLIVQVAGRAGREKEMGKVIIQTYNPDNYSIQYAQKQEYLPFYEVEIMLRKQLKYPPFCDIIMLGISGEEVQEVKQTAEYLYTLLKEAFLKQEIEGNVLQALPAPVDKIKNRYRYRIIIKTELTEQVNTAINECLEQYYKTSKAKAKIRVIADCNPINML